MKPLEFAILASFAVLLLLNLLNWRYDFDLQLMIVINCEDEHCRLFGTEET